MSIGQEHETNFILAELQGRLHVINTSRIEMVSQGRNSEGDHVIQMRRKGHEDDVIATYDDEETCREDMRQIAEEFRCIELPVFLHSDEQDL